MTKKTQRVMDILILLLLLTAGCQITPELSVGGADKISVSVSILPQAYFVERIAGEFAEVNVMVGPGDDPHSYEPTPSQMRLLDKTDVYFSIGVEFEAAWLPRFRSANPSMLVVDAAEGAVLIPMASAHGDEHAGELDPHVWLSPARVRIIASNIASSMAEIDPDHALEYQANLDVFMADIDALDDFIHDQLDSAAKRQFLTYHPAWGYFADDYDLEMIAIEIGGQEPGAESLVKTIQLMQTYELHTIFLQREFSSKSAQAIAEETGAEVVVLDPLAYNWLASMHSMAEEFASALN